MFHISPSLASTLGSRIGDRASGVPATEIGARRCARVGSIGLAVARSFEQGEACTCTAGGLSRARPAPNPEDIMKKLAGIAVVCAFFGCARGAGNEEPKASESGGSEQAQAATPALPLADKG